MKQQGRLILCGWKTRGGMFEEGKELPQERRYVQRRRVLAPISPTNKVSRDGRRHRHIAGLYDKGFPAHYIWQVFLVSTIIVIEMNITYL